MILEHFKAWLLIPAAAAGVFTSLMFQFPPRGIGDAVMIVGIISGLLVLPAILLAYAWSRPVDGRTIGHTGCVWTILLAIAWGLGFGLTFLVE